jgi:membrane protease YdiL (CAAX protease family)
MGSLVAFFSLTYVVTWACFFGVAALSPPPDVSVPPDPPREALRGVLLYLGVFAPSLVALALTAAAEGRAGALALLRRVLRWRVAAGWYVFAIGYMAAIKLAAALVYRVAKGAWPPFGSEAWYVMAVGMLLSAPFQSGEEIGWRGFALPRMAERMGLAGASVVLGVVWACWHLPVFFLIPQADTYGQSFPAYLLQVTALSVAFAWLYSHTKGSLLLVMLLHAAVNNTKDVVPSAVRGATNAFALSTSPIAWITVALLWICAAYFLIRMPKLETS